QARREHGGDGAGAFAQLATHGQGVAHLHPVAAAKFQVVHAQVGGNFVHQAFHGEVRLGRAIAAVGAGRGQVGVDHVAVEAAAGHVVGAQTAQAGAGLHGEAVRAVGAGVAD